MYKGKTFRIKHEEENKVKKILAIVLALACVLSLCACGGGEEATALGCDLSYEYVRINGDYRS